MGLGVEITYLPVFFRDLLSRDHQREVKDVVPLINYGCTAWSLFGGSLVSTPLEEEEGKKSSLSLE